MSSVCGISTQKWKKFKKKVTSGLPKVWPSFPKMWPGFPKMWTGFPKCDPIFPKIDPVSQKCDPFQNYFELYDKNVFGILLGDPVSQKFYPVSWKYESFLKVLPSFSKMCTCFIKKKFKTLFKETWSHLPKPGRMFWEIGSCFQETRSTFRKLGHIFGLPIRISNTFLSKSL